MGQRFNSRTEPKFFVSNPTDVLGLVLGPKLVTRLSITFGSSKIKHSD